MSQDTFQQNYKLLNPEQLQAVDSLYGPIMVVAGPGTGKTQIISLRTANIILKAGVDPENILITTFTEAWVIALKKRLTKFIGTDAYKVKICTIHSFAQDVITQFPEKFIEQRAGTTIDDIESLEFFTHILDTKITDGEIEYLFHPSDRFTYLRDIKSRIGTLKSEWISPEQFDTIIKNQRDSYNEALEALKDNKRIRDLEKRTAKDALSYDTHIAKLTELNLLYRAYQQHLKDNNLYDFSDMINFAVDKMRIDEELTSYYAEKYQFIMLDEYQDTNNPQNEIMNLIIWVGEEKNIMVVWDDDQSIYRFQWANIENMLDFYTLYPETQFIVLKNNYRSSQSILDISQNVIENNAERLVNRLDFLDKTLTAQSSHKDLTLNASYILPDDSSEKIFVYEKIKSLSPPSSSWEEASGWGWSIAIIVRSNREVQQWSDFMQSQWLEVSSKLKTNILSNPYVSFLLNLMTLIDNPYHNDAMFLDILRSNIVDIENRDIITLSRNLYKSNYSRNGFQLQIWDILKNLDPDSLTTENPYRDIEKLVWFRDTLCELQSHTGSISELFHTLMNHFWFVEYIEAHGAFSDLEDIFTLLNTIKSWNEHNPGLLLPNLLNKCELHKKYNIIIPRQILKKTISNIEILTAHGSKWLEYDHVYIPWVYGGNWESKSIVDKLKLPLGITGQWLQLANLEEKDAKKIAKEMGYQEDRRLFFVACTRAAKSLTLTRPAGKDNKPYIESPFLVETGLTSQMIDQPADEAILKNSLITQLTGTHSLNQTSQEEIEYIAEFLETYKLSATDLNTFLEDPLVFLKNSVFKYPFVDNEYTIFGKIYHRVLELATMQKQEGITVSLESMLENFSFLLDKQVLTPEEKIRLAEKWRLGLTGYYEIFSKTPRTPLHTEYNFRGRNISFEWIPLTGKIDKIEELENTSSITVDDWENLKEGQSSLFSQSVAIVDYKTGGIKTSGNIKWTDRYGNTKPGYEHGKYYRQLMFYKLLCENDAELSRLYDVSEFALDFVEGKDEKYNYQPIEIEGDDYEDFKKLVQDVWEKMHDIEYWKEVLGEVK